MSTESGQFSQWGRGARLTRRVREEPSPGELARVYFDRNATQSAAQRIHLGRAVWTQARTGKPHPRIDRARAGVLRNQKREIERSGLGKQLARIQEGIQRLEEEIAERARQIGRGFGWSR